MTKVYEVRWAPVAWLDALLKRMAILIASVVVSSGVMFVVTLFAGSEDELNKRTVKFLLYVTIVLGGWILWNLVRLIVDPIRTAITGKFLGDKTAREAKPVAREAKPAADDSSPVLARVRASNAQTPPDLIARMKSEFVLVPSEEAQVNFMKMWVGTGDPSSPQSRYGRVDPEISGISTKKLANDVFDFMKAYNRPPFGSAPAGTDEALLVVWLRGIVRAERAGTLTGDDAKALRSLNRWSKGWDWGLDL